MSDPIQEAIAQAQAKQAAASTALANAPAPTQGAVAEVVKPGPKMTMEQLSAGSMSVDKWVKVNEDGIKIGDGKLIPDGFIATIDMTDGRGFVPKMAIKGGNPAQYAYSLDGVTAVSGGSWEAAQARIRALAGAGAATPYRAVDLPFTLVEDVKDMSGAVVGKAGEVVGYTTSTTNWANWETFYRAVGQAGLMGSTVKVKLTQQARSAKGNNWGVVRFELIEETE